MSRFECASVANNGGCGGAVPIKLWRPSFAVSHDAEYYLRQWGAQHYSQDNDDFVESVLYHVNRVARRAPELTRDELIAVVWYTSDVRAMGHTQERNWWCYVNNKIRQRDIDALTPHLDSICYLQRAIDKRTKTDPLELWRGLSVSVTETSKWYRVGETMCWPSFTSLSTDQTVMDRFANSAKRTMILIEANRYSDISDLSMSAEEERIFGINTVVEISLVVKSSDLAKFKQVTLPPNVDFVIAKQLQTPQCFVVTAPPPVPNSPSNPKSEHCCRKGHSLTLVTQPPYPAGQKCDECKFCRENGNQEQWGHCSACRYDMCPNCMAHRCRKGHPLTFAVKSPYGKVQPRCDECRLVRSNCDVAWGTCASCQYNICPACFQRAVTHCRTDHLMATLVPTNCASPVTCDGCREKRPLQCDEAWGRCSECDFDLCPNCLHPSPFPCRAGHSLRFTASSPYPVGEPVCDECRRERIVNCQTPWGHCATCHYDVCTECIQRSTLTCSRYHKLSWMLKTPSNYSGAALCDACRRERPDGETVAWGHCRLCQYDVCPDCVHRTDVHCFGGHPVALLPQSPYQNGAGEQICDECRSSRAKGNSELWGHCVFCGYDICPRCFQRPQARCAKGHRMRCVVQSPYTNARPTCVTCDRERGNASAEAWMHCPACHYDICTRCREHRMTRCPRAHHLKIVTQAPYPSGRQRCDECKKERPAKSSDAWGHCPSCEYDVCPSCAE